jgi:hypothetical protein
MNRSVLTALTPRASLLTLGSVGLAILAPTNAIHARKKRRKNRNKGDVFKFCKQQTAECLDFFLPACEDDLICQATVETCCPEVGQCDFTGFILCLDDAQATVELAGPLFRRPNLPSAVLSARLPPRSNS